MSAGVVSKEGDGIECYCTATSPQQLHFTPPLPMLSCRNCWRCTGPHERSDSFTGGKERYLGCFGKGVRSIDGREGQWCTIFLPRWDRSPETMEMVQKQGWQMKSPDEMEKIQKEVA